MAHYQLYIEEKHDRSSLTIIDLLHVSNFKGGNASITEPASTLNNKLDEYSKIVREIEKKYAKRALTDISKRETAILMELCNRMLSMTKRKDLKIRGFGASYASALLSAHFTNLIPILDRRILNGAGISVQYNSQMQVKNIEQHYSCLIAKCQTELSTRKPLTLRALDREWFTKPLHKLKRGSPSE